MSIKSELRKSYKSIRKNIEGKSLKDIAINSNLIKLQSLMSYDTILFYAALKDEADIDLSVKAALSCGKKVALPVCIDNNGKMQYYYIRSFDDLKIASFGVREPDIKACKPVKSFDNAICIVPAIAFDKAGHRIGYGKGYYDRFLCNFNGVSIGVAYDECVTDSLPYDKYDIPVDYLVTQSGVFVTEQGGKNG